MSVCSGNVRVLVIGTNMTRGKKCDSDSSACRSKLVCYSEKSDARNCTYVLMGLTEIELVLAPVSVGFPRLLLSCRDTTRDPSDRLRSARFSQSISELCGSHES